MKFARILFIVAGLYGILALTPLYFLERFVGRIFPPAINHPEFFYGFIGVVVVWHFLFLAIARDVVRYRPLMLLGVAEKLVFGIPTVALYLQGRVATAILFGAIVDIVFGLLFLVAYQKTGKATVPAGSWQTT